MTFRRMISSFILTIPQGSTRRSRGEMAIGRTFPALERGISAASSELLPNWRTNPAFGRVINAFERTISPGRRATQACGRAIEAFRQAILAMFMLALAPIASAEVVRIDVDRREDIAGGAGYGNVGPYERLSGRIHCAVDPANSANRIVTDIDFAPANGAGIFVPFARTRSEREATGDPRQSIEERYGILNRYLEMVEEAALPLMYEGYLRPEDMLEIFRAAEIRWRFVMLGGE